MLNKSQRDSFIKPDQLCVGLYVHLDLHWTQHPFSFSSFKIEKPDQIATIRSLGLEKIRYTPQKSDCNPPDIALKNAKGELTEVKVVTENNPKAAAKSQEEVSGFNDKLQLIARMVKQAEKIQECEKIFLAHLRALKLMWQNLFSNPVRVSEEATKLVHTMAGSALMESEIAVHLMLDHKMVLTSIPMQ